ncbi:hypothetical protein IBX73_06810 [candidate division WOR-3 bacterium]|nr:hypothetical protein [candidate division WOR-3 bacterium]
MKIWKKVLIGLGIFLVIIILLGVTFFFRAQQMHSARAPEGPDRTVKQIPTC